MPRFDSNLGSWVGAFLALWLGAVAWAQDLSDLKKRLADPDYEVRKAAISVLWREGEESKLGQDKIQLLLPLLASDPDWRIKCRVISVLRYTHDKDWVYTALVKTLEDKDPVSNGKGLVPLYAVDALDYVGETRSIPQIEAWLKALETKEQVIDFQEKSIKTVRDKLESLKAKQLAAATPSSKAHTTKTGLSYARFLKEVEALVARHYPDAKVTSEGATIHFDCHTRVFMIHEPLKTGQWQDARETIGPQPGGVVCRMEFGQGKYLAQAVLPMTRDKLYFVTQVTATESTKLDHYLVVHLSYPRNVSAEFLKSFQSLVDRFADYCSTSESKR